MVFPHPGGPCTNTTNGGGSSCCLSRMGARSFRCCFSAAIVLALRALDELLKMNAFGLLPLACASPFFFFSLAFFFFAFAPARGARCSFDGATASMATERDRRYETSVVVAKVTPRAAASPPGARSVPAQKPPASPPPDSTKIPTVSRDSDLHRRAQSARVVVSTPRSSDCSCGGGFASAAKRRGMRAFTFFTYENVPECARYSVLSVREICS